MEQNLQTILQGQTLFHRPEVISFLYFIIFWASKTMVGLRSVKKMVIGVPFPYLIWAQLISKACWFFQAMKFNSIGLLVRFEKGLSGQGCSLVLASLVQWRTPILLFPLPGWAGWNHMATKTWFQVAQGEESGMIRIAAALPLELLELQMEIRS